MYCQVISVTTVIRPSISYHYCNMYLLVRVVFFSLGADSVWCIEKIKSDHYKSVLHRQKLLPTNCQLISFGIIVICKIVDFFCRSVTQKNKLHFLNGGFFCELFYVNIIHGMVTVLQKT